MVSKLILLAGTKSKERFRSLQVITADVADRQNVACAEAALCNGNFIAAGYPEVAFSMVVYETYITALGELESGESVETTHAELHVDCAALARSAQSAAAGSSIRNGPPATFCWTRRRYAKSNENRKKTLNLFMSTTFSVQLAS